MSNTRITQSPAQRQARQRSRNNMKVQASKTLYDDIVRLSREITGVVNVNDLSYALHTYETTIDSIDALCNTYVTRVTPV